MTTCEYIRDLFEPDDRIVICWKLHAEKAFQQRFLTAAAGAEDRFQRFLRAMNAQGNNIYIGMNPLRPQASRRTKADILEVRRVYLDLDRDGDTALENILRSPKLPQPNYLINTSPTKHQVIWNVRGFDPPAAESLMRSLASEFHADHTIDVSRVFRLPGLYNKKYESSFRVTARKLTSVVHAPAAFPACDSPSFSPPGRHRRLSTPRHSESERDWGYCCTALWANPDDPVVVARLLAEMERRAQGRRAKPRYYAELTVTNARSYIAAKRALSREVNS